LLQVHCDAGSSANKDTIELAIFDIDGPVTDPESRRIEQSEILDLTLDFITERGYVAYNTGRASTVAYQRVISPLLARALARGMNSEIVSRRIAIFAEKGGVSSRWDDELGQWNHRIDPAAKVPADLRSEVVDLLRSDLEFQTYIFHDSAKETMVSVEMRHETLGPAPVPVTVSVFKPVAERFAAEVRQLARDRGYDDIEVDCTTIAVDIQCRGVGKDLGTRLAFCWLDRLGKRVERVHCFGDSKSDVAMAVEALDLMSRSFADAGERVVYVHVGVNLSIEGGFAVRSFPGGYWRGTVAYLRSLSRGTDGQPARNAAAQRPASRDGDPHVGRPANMTS
jgi:hydroxymethylpyrimidine pyrophosphatase-like HAD family hydrolase